MRELVLNHASLASAGWHETVKWLPDVAEGIAALVRGGAAQKILRMCDWMGSITCAEGQSLHEACRELQRQGERDKYVFLMGLSNKAPLLSGLEPDIADRFLMCEAKTLPPEDGAPLVLCAVTDAISVSVPSETVWDIDWISVTFRELLPDETFGRTEEDIDNLARSMHAVPIVDRHRKRLQRQCSDAADLWRRRLQMFPHLTFGLDVEDHLGRLNPGLVQTLVNRLADLDETAAAWVADGGDGPSWRTLVTPESDKLMNNPKLRDGRRFRSVNGERVLFEWHARFGSRERIHLRFDARVQEIEIGYVGGHLPLR